MKKPFIARDTKEPLVVFGGYPIAEDGSILYQPISHRINYQSINASPLIESVADPELARYGEACEVRVRVAKNRYEWRPGKIYRVLNAGDTFEVYVDDQNFATRLRKTDVQVL